MAPFVAAAWRFVVALAVVPAATAQPASSSRVTFNRDVAPILFARCAGCHRPGEVGPFSLMDYEDARQRASLIASVTASRLMPPWKPEAGLVEYADARTLSAGEIQTIQNWVAQGAVEGDAADRPALPARTDGWQLGTPDLIVSMPAPFMLAADGPDVFRTVVLPIPTDMARYVAAIEFRPDTPRAVHHANIGIDRTRSSRRLDALDPEPGYSGGMVADASYPPGHMLGWTPGQRPRPSPEGASWRLERESDLVAQLHLQPTGRPEAVTVRVGFHFTDVPPVRTPVGLRLGSQTIDIAIGESAYEIQDSYVLPVDVDVLAVQPHAHNLARRMEAAALLPDGSTRPLLAIADWDFRWQEVYRFATPFTLPRGTTIAMRFTYDNSAANPRNPHQPPQRVVWGQNTTDEMGDLWLQVVPRTAADLATLNADVNRKRWNEDFAAYAELLRLDPENPLRHDAVALLYLQGGDLGLAVAHFRESLRLNPQSAPTAYNLGLALSGTRRFAEAAAAFQQALELDPQHPQAANNLGAMWQVLGRLDEAAASYRRAIALSADNAEAHNNLGRLLSLQGQGPEAVRHLREARALRPESASIAAGLAWALATSIEPAADPAEAVALGEAAATATGRTDAVALDALAAAYAAARQFERAVTVAREAILAAERSGSTALADLIRQRLALYQQGIPYRLAPTPPSPG